MVPQANKGSDVYDADLIKHDKTPADMLIRLQESSAPNKRAIFRVPRKVNSITQAGLITKIVTEVKEKLRSLGVATALSAIGPELVVEYSSRIVELLRSRDRLVGSHPYLQNSEEIELVEALRAVIHVGESERDLVFSPP